MTYHIAGLGYPALMPLSAIFQLYRGHLRFPISIRNSNFVLDHPIIIDNVCTI